MGSAFLGSELNGCGSRDGNHWNVIRVNRIGNFCYLHFKNHTRIDAEFH